MWSPSRERVETARVSALMRRLGVADLAELRRRSATEPDWFWRAVVDDLGIPFEHQFTRVLDESRGPEWATWFTDGTINQATACVGRWAADPVAGDRVALLAESEDGAVRRLTFRDLDDAVSQVAAALRASGLVSGGAVGVMMPMVPEAVVAMLGIARAGGVAVPVFSGFAAPAVAARMCDAGARIVLCADGAVRRGRSVPIRDVAERAAREAGCVDEIVVLGPAGGSGGGPIGVSWDAFLARAADASGEPAPTGAEDPVLLAYTSGTTGRPKGAVHVHGGLTVKVASEAAYALDIGAGERLLWLTDMGWIMGPWSMIGSLALGATMVLYDGAPDAPDPGRIWSLVERHRVTHLGVSPTLIRSLSGHGEGWAAAHDLSSLRIIGSTGEPWNPHGYGWLRARTEASDPPIINISGGTEVGAVILSPYPVEPIGPCSLGGPCLGMAADVFGPGGESVRGEVGELVVTRPWPGMTRGIHGDPERYIETYWSTYSGVWRHGDWARVDTDGQWYLLGRSDETMNVAGKRIGSAEVEAVLVDHPAVREAAAVGVPDPLTGEALWCVWSPARPDGPDVSPELSALVVSALGKPFRPARVMRAPDLPRTRSGKLLRRALRAVVAGEEPGDLSTAENPEALEAVRAALAGVDG